MRSTIIKGMGTEAYKEEEEWYVRSAFERIAMLSVVFIPLALTVFALIALHTEWPFIALMVSLYFITGMGVTIGFHRMMTHKSFETTTTLKALLLFVAVMAVEGSPLEWGATHKKHHTHSDQPGYDPHTPVGLGIVRGLWYSHMGWMLQSRKANVSRFSGGFQRDPLVSWFHRIWWKILPLTLLFPMLVGGVLSVYVLHSTFLHGMVAGVIWGGFVRIVLTHHITWSINSVCHTFGQRPFKTPTGDQSRNNLICGLLGHGEGWHCNHHKFERSAFHGFYWWQVDTSGYVIRLLELLGLAWNVYYVDTSGKEPALKVRSTRFLKAA